MSVRHRGRELAFQILFQCDQTEDKVNAVVARFQELRRANADAAAMAEDLGVGAFQAQAQIDKLIRSAAEHWKLERLLSVDRAVLRLAVFELEQRGETPMEVVLDEAIELAKKFGSDDSPAFVNGVLDRLARQLRPDEKPKRAAKPRSHPIPKAKAKIKGRPKASAQAKP
jgi:N utilization substance protein B